MVDIETLGSHPESVILSIGACYFSLPNGAPAVPKFYKNISVTSSLKHGLTVEGRTIYWWMKQSPGALAALQTPEPEGLREVLSAFRRWLPTDPSTFYIWSHGSNFDLTIIGAAYTKIDQMPPWMYKNVRDTRTLFWLAPGYEQSMERAKTREMNFVRHNALDDAVKQVQWVQTAWRLLHGDKAPPLE